MDLESCLSDFHGTCYGQACVFSLIKLQEVDWSSSLPSFNEGCNLVLVSAEWTPSETALWTGG